MESKLWPKDASLNPLLFNRFTFSTCTDYMTEVTLRDLFAALAPTSKFFEYCADIETDPHRRYRYADAMLAERIKVKP